MNCTRAKSEIALWTGGDLDERATVQLERHIAVCPDCREYRGRMSESLQVLHKPAATVPSTLHDSVWPDVESRLAIQSQIEFERAERLNRWLPAAAVAAACLAIMAFTSQPQSPPRDMFGQILPSDLHEGDLLSSDGLSARADLYRKSVGFRPPSPQPGWQPAGSLNDDPAFSSTLLHRAGHIDSRSNDSKD